MRFTLKETNVCTVRVTLSLKVEVDNYRMVIFKELIPTIQRLVENFRSIRIVKESSRYMYFEVDTGGIGNRKRADMEIQTAKEKIYEFLRLTVHENELYPVKLG